MRHPDRPPASRASRPVVVQPGDGVEMHVLDETATFKVGAADVGGAFSLIELTTPPGGGVGLHANDSADAVLYVVEGVYALRLGEQTTELGVGACALVPRGILHAVTNAGPSTARLLVFSAPATTPERLFIELATLFASGAAGSPELAAALGLVATARGVTLPTPPSAGSGGRARRG